MRFSLTVSKITFVLAFILAISSSWVFADSSTPIDLPKHEPIILKFPAFDPTRTLIDEMQLLQGIATALKSNTKIPLTSDKARPIAELSGMHTIVQAQNSRILLRYIHVEKYDNRDEYGQWLLIPIDYQIARGDNDVTITLLPSQKGELVTKSLLIIPPKKIGQIDDIITDSTEVLNAAARLKVSLNCLVKGEVNSNFKPDSVIGNFERALGRYTYGYNEPRSYDPKIDNVFAYRIDQTRAPLKVSTYPYHDGTKLTYEIQMPYQVSSDGSSDGADLAQKLKGDMERIVNE